MAPHQRLYQQSGRLRVRMEDGTEAAAGNAETTPVPQDTTPGFMGNEPAAEQGMTKRSQSESSTIAVSSGRAAACARRRSPGSGTHLWPRSRT